MVGPAIRICYDRIMVVFKIGLLQDLAAESAAGPAESGKGQAGEPLKLGPAAEELIRRLFPPDQQPEAVRFLTEECGYNMPWPKPPAPEEIERLRAALVKLAGGELEKLKEWVSEISAVLVSAAAPHREPRSFPPLKLSPATEERLKRVFAPEQWPEAARLLMEECGNNLPFCQEMDEFRMERIRFAVLKLAAGDLDKLRKWIKDAQRDWRDTLMDAGFGEDVTAHLRWEGRAGV